MYSGRHQLSREDAIYLMTHNGLEWGTGMDTWADRDRYRKQIAGIKKRKKNYKEEQREKGKGKGRKGGKGDGPYPNSSVKDETCEWMGDGAEEYSEQEAEKKISELAQLPNRSLASALCVAMFGEEASTSLSHLIHQNSTRALASGDQAAVLRLDTTFQDIYVNSDQLKHIRDTLLRADEALSHAKQQLLNQAQSCHGHQAILREAIVAIQRMAYVTCSYLRWCG